jgi:hypothetical protein
MEHDKIICVYCKKNAKLITSNNNTAVICTNCGIAIELETYKELFDNRITSSKEVLS